MIGKTILQNEKNKLIAKKLELDRQINLINTYLNDAEQISLEQANCFMSWTTHSDLNFYEIKSKLSIDK